MENRWGEVVGEDIEKAVENRWGEVVAEDIEKAMENLTPRNTVTNKRSQWKQFMDFCGSKGYKIGENSSVSELALILKNWAFNMRRKDGTDYKESAIKTLWNNSAKTLQEMFYKDYNIKFNPFTDVEFLEARKARDAKRKELKRHKKYRKESATAFTSEENVKMLEVCDERTPEGLQKKFFLIASKELAWRGNEAAYATLFNFHSELDNYGNRTGRIEYNPIFSKTNQGGSKRYSDSKWLISNSDENNCPVRLYHKLMERRPKHVTTDRFFLTPNPQWQHENSPWFKNSPVGIHKLSSWTKEIAQKAGIDTNNKKITNLSHRSTAVTHLGNANIPDQQLIIITGHGNANSIQPHLTMQPTRHEQIIEAMQGNAQEMHKDQSGIATGIPSDIGAILATASAGTSQLKRLHLEESSTSSLEEVPRKKPRFILPLANEGVNIAKKSPVSPINITKAPVLLRIEAKLDKVLLEIEKVKSRLSSLEDKFDAHFGPQPLRKPDTYPIQSLQSFFDLEKISSKGERIAQQKYLQTLEAHDIKSFVNLAMKNSIADEVIKNHFTLHGSDSKIKLEGTEFLNMIYLAAQSCTFFEGPYWISDIFPYVAEAVRSAQMDDEHLVREHNVIIPSQDTYEGDHCKNENEEIEEHNYSTDGYDENESAFVKVEVESDIDEIDEKPNLFLE